MFGYVKPYKPEMKVKEYDTFKGIYCGLCKQLSHDYTPLASLTLSNDFAFVALLSLAIKKDCGGFKKCRCVANPLKKKACHVACADLSFCTSTAMIMFYYKIKDNLQDGGFFYKILNGLLLPFAALARKKAKKRLPEIDDIVNSAMADQRILEEKCEKSADRAAHPSAEALGAICEYLSDNAEQKQVLHRFGYMLGRYIYFTDALDDLESDLKNGGYNPLLLTKGELLSAKEYGKQIADMTIGELAPAYELISLNRYKPILDNFIYLGLHNELYNIYTKENKEKQNERSVQF